MVSDQHRKETDLTVSKASRESSPGAASPAAPLIVKGQARPGVSPWASLFTSVSAPSLFNPPSSLVVNIFVSYMITLPSSTNKQPS